MGLLRNLGFGTVTGGDSRSGIQIAASKLAAEMLWLKPPKGNAIPRVPTGARIFLQRISRARSNKLRLFHRLFIEAQKWTVLFGKRATSRGCSVSFCFERDELKRGELAGLRICPNS